MQDREDTEGKETPFFMPPLLQTLMEREREVCLELQATHDILSDTCSRNGEQLEAEPLGTCEITVVLLSDSFSLFLHTVCTFVLHIMC